MRSRVAQDKPLCRGPAGVSQAGGGHYAGPGTDSDRGGGQCGCDGLLGGCDDTIVVAATETLGAYADWLNTSPARLRTLNHVRGAGRVQIGHKLKLDFAHGSHEQFEARRRDYHRQLQAAYFASHRISGTRCMWCAPGTRCGA